MIIKSLLDTDFYSFSQQMAVLHHYPSAWVRYAFKWRNWDKMIKIDIRKFAEELGKELDALCELRFAEYELEYLSSIPFLKADYIEYLRMFKLNRDFIRVYITGDDSIDIEVMGPWPNTILFETPVLAIVSQLYGDAVVKQGVYIPGVLEGKLMKKISVIKDSDIKFADFGTRRRRSVGRHEYILRSLMDYAPNNIIGTSNAMFANMLGLKPIGTMSHQWLQAHQQLGPRLADSQKVALQTWADEYRGELGIALSDCLGFDMFLKDFDRYFALLFDGCRHDSGDPVWWCEKLIEHYKKLRIDPKTKSAVFSDGLNFEKAIELHEKFSGQINVSFGVGTHLTNDCEFTAPQIVLKMVECNGKPVAKISDSKGKGMCEDKEFESYLTKVIKERSNE